MTNTQSSSTPESGFGLVEAVVATFITATGVLSVAILMMVGTKLQMNAANGSMAVGLATWELERIRTLVPTAPERVDGGSLDADQPDHFIVRGRTTLRWQIANRDDDADGVPDLCAPVGGVPGEPLECAKEIVVTAITPDEKAQRPIVRSTLFR